MVVIATKLLKTLMICLAFSCETMAQSKKETKAKTPLLVWVRTYRYLLSGLMT